MAAEKSSLKRKPLSDCTNTVAASAAAASRRKLSLKPSVSRSRGSSSSLDQTASLKSNPSTGSNYPPIPTTSSVPSPIHSPYSSLLPQRQSTYDDIGKSSPSLVQSGRQNTQTRKNKRKMVVEDFMIDRSHTVTPSSLQLSSSAASGTSSLLTPKFQTTYTRRKAPETRKYRDKKLIEPFGCPPGKRLKDIGDQLDDCGGDGQSGMHTDTLLLPKRQSRTKTIVKGSVHAMPKEEVDKLRAYYADIDTSELPVEEACDSDLD